MTYYQLVINSHVKHYSSDSHSHPICQIQILLQYFSTSTTMLNKFMFIFP